MRWEDERYVRLYTRDTVDWNMWPWQSRALFPLLLRKLDRAGIFELGKHGMAGLADAVRLPVEVVDAGLAGLIVDGCLERRGEVLVMRSFIEAQESSSTDAQRKRDQRERARSRAQYVELTGQEVTKRDQESQNGTKSHAQSHGVTSGHSVPSVPCLPNTESVSDCPPDPLGKAANATQRKIVTRHEAAARNILDAFNAARRRVNSRAREIGASYASLAHISERLEAGKTSLECLHVIDVVEDECRKTPESFKWFTTVTPFRADNFEMKLQRTVNGQKGNGAVADMAQRSVDRIKFVDE